ncbi:sulfatase-like hydrolase/transferase [Stieleria sp. ICT_E10.1]|uniref:sulfatase family protein n=1 Tax=Stieleria sedimenti TaxID=2976331 RepID=UPI00217FAAEE|nr:sulfatase-like hydrolase/transferase [Stieleria sedimenti]MCS7469589.1 sulfatase-like hydrolase/transferase [Stieleria sedimenti]
MNRQLLSFISQLLLAFLLVIAFSAGTQAADDRPPNIVFMFADDLGYGDLGCYGHPYAKTPALDQLAKEGTRFTQYYVTGVTCNPSRTGLMTGLFPARFPKYAADFGFGERLTITELLKERGYRTGHFGKWHIGPDEENGTYGIDTVKVIGKSRDKTTGDAGRDDDLYSAAIDFIKKNKDEPFYVNVWGHATHFPVNTAEGLVAGFNDVTVDRNDFSPTMQHKFDESQKISGDLDESMRQYLGDVYQIDRNVDRLLKTLDELGLSDNTIVVFSSDHGPAPVILSKQEPRKYSNNMLGYAGEFRGGKHEQYEGGTRVPFIVRWPGKVEAGRVDTQNVCSFIDWLPTLCAIAGVDELPKPIDGEDISDIWFGTDRERTKPLFWKTSAVGATPAMREGNWKLHLPRKQRGEPELYDLSIDPSESRNVAEQHPDVVKTLSRKVKAWAATLPTEYSKKKVRSR